MNNNLRLINLNHNANIIANQIEIYIRTLKDHRNYRFAGINGMLNDLDTVIKLMKKHADIQRTMTKIKGGYY